MSKTFVKICLILGEAWVKGQGHKGQKVQQACDAVLDTFPLDYDFDHNLLLLTKMLVG